MMPWMDGATKGRITLALHAIIPTSVFLYLILWGQRGAFHFVFGALIVIMVMFVGFHGCIVTSIEK